MVEKFSSRMCRCPDGRLIVNVLFILFLKYLFCLIDIKYNIDLVWLSPSHREETSQPLHTWSGELHVAEGSVNDVSRVNDAIYWLRSAVQNHTKLSVSTTVRRSWLDSTLSRTRDTSHSYLCTPSCDQRSNSRNY